LSEKPPTFSDKLWRFYKRAICFILDVHITST
jgi:hypothetical protein